MVSNNKANENGPLEGEVPSGNDKLPKAESGPTTAAEAPSPVAADAADDAADQSPVAGANLEGGVPPEGNKVDDESATQSSNKYDRFRVSQDYLDSGGSREQLTIKATKPDKEWFVRTHPESEYWFDAYCVEIKALDNQLRGLYLVEPQVSTALQDEKTFGPRRLVTSVTRQGNLFLWPLRFVGRAGQLDEWAKSALNAAERANEWIRVVAGQAGYDLVAAKGAIPEPDWPDKTIFEILETAFDDRIIDSVNHPVVQSLLGA